MREGVHEDVRHRRHWPAIISIILGCSILAFGTALMMAVNGRDVGADIALSLHTTCDDFTSWSAAQDHFAHLDPTSVEAHILDSNRNNIPCEGSKPRDHQTHEIFDVICADFHHRDEAEKFF